MEAANDHMTLTFAPYDDFHGREWKNQLVGQVVNGGRTLVYWQWQWTMPTMLPAEEGEHSCLSGDSPPCLVS